MAYFDFTSLDELMEDLEAIADLPDAVAKEMLMAQAEIIAEAQQRAAVANGLVDTGQMKESIEVDSAIKTSGLDRYVDVYPRGTRADGVRNAEVAFIHEYGAPGKHISAKAWIKQANESVAERADAAAMEVYNKYLQSKNL